jgi:hypothetical protein
MKFSKKTKAAVIGILGVTYMTLCGLTMPTPAVADAINGILEFTIISGSPTPTGTFSYDTTTNYNSIIVNWYGAAFYFSLGNVTPEVLGSGGSWGGSATYFPIASDAKPDEGPPGIGYANSQTLMFYLEPLYAPGTETAVHGVRNFYNVPPPVVGASGSFTVATPSSTPEPATVLLLGFGLIGVAGVSRKKS